MSKVCNVFVYGTLMRGFGNHSLMRGSNFIGVAITNEKYVLLGSGIPYITKEGDSYEMNKDKASRVTGELYQVDESRMPSLDSLEGHPIWYKRELVPVTVINSNGDKFTTDAWIYFNSKESGTVIPDGSYRTYCNEQESWYNEYRKRGINV